MIMARIGIVHLVVSLMLVIQLFLPAGIGQVLTNPTNIGIVGIKLGEGGNFSLTVGNDYGVLPHGDRLSYRGDGGGSEHVQPAREDVASPALMGTELARVFLDADVRLRGLVKRALMWEGVTKEVEGIGGDSSEVGPAFRVWIWPKRVRIGEGRDRKTARRDNLELGGDVEFTKGDTELKRTLIKSMYYRG